MIRPLIAALLLGSILTQPAAATVTFSFMETGTLNDCFIGPCGLQLLRTPRELMSITLSSGTETGEAESNGTMFGNTPPPVVTDPNFSFLGPGGAIEAGIGPVPFFEYGVFYDMHWVAVAGQLTYLSLIYDNSLNESSFSNFGLTGGLAIRDQGCALTPNCQVTGFWTDPRSDPIPEPGSLALLLSALLLGGGIVFRRA
jgi:hypothetical protein